MLAAVDNISHRDKRRFVHVAMDGRHVLLHRSECMDFNLRELELGDVLEIDTIEEQPLGLYARDVRWGSRPGPITARVTFVREDRGYVLAMPDGAFKRADAVMLHCSEYATLGFLQEGDNVSCVVRNSKRGLRGSNVQRA